MTVLKTLLFDLDGTLTDPKPGITRSIQHALKTLKRPVPSEDDLLWCIGPPLRDSFAALLASSDDALLEQAVTIYRERYGLIGLYENQVYPGVTDTLAYFARRGYRIFVATSKPTIYAHSILEHFGLLEYFDAIHGSEMDGQRSNKSELLRYAIEQESIIPESAMMFGDRSHDIVGAKQNKLLAGGVLYGYGTVDELKAAGADYLFGAPKTIVQFLENLSSHSNLLPT